MTLLTELRDDTLFYTWEEEEKPDVCLGFEDKECIYKGDKEYVAHGCACKIQSNEWEQSCILARQNACVAADQDLVKKLVLLTISNHAFPTIEKNRPYVLPGYRLDVKTLNESIPSKNNTSTVTGKFKKVGILVTLTV